MRQQTLAQGSFEKYRKPTRRERFLNEMDKIVPWDQLCALVEPVYPKVKGTNVVSGLESLGMECHDHPAIIPNSGHPC